MEFSVNVENVQWNRNKRNVVSVTKLVAVKVYGFTLVMKHKMSGILVRNIYPFEYSMAYKATLNVALHAILYLTLFSVFSLLSFR